MEQYLTRAQAAQSLEMSTRTLDRICAAGRLGKHYFSDGVVRLSASEIERYKADSRIVRTPEIKKSRKKSAKHRAPARSAWKPGEKLV